MLIYTEYYDSLVKGVLPAYNNNFRLAGAHSVVVVGYDDNKQMLKLRFNWTANFGDNGYVYLRYLDLQKIVTQAFAICKVIS